MVVRSKACEKGGGAYGAQLGTELFTFSEDYRKFRTDSAAHKVFKACKRDHVQHPESTLHNLPIQARIDYKLKTVTSFSLTRPLPV